MTAFDIYSALGNVSEDMLDESETSAPKPKIGIICTSAAAACIAVLAVVLRFAFSESDIVATVPDDSLNAITTYSVPEFSEFTCIPSAETADSLPAGVPNIDAFSESISEETFANDDAYSTVSETTEVHTTAAAVYENDEEIAVIPQWEDLSEMEKYTNLEYKGNEYTITQNRFNESELTFLRNGELYGFDYYEYCYKDVEENIGRHSKPCSFYKINNVSEDYMIAVPTADGNYTGFVNWQYIPDSLGAYLYDIDFSNRYKLTTIKSEPHDLVDGEVDSHYFEYDLPDLQQAVEKLLAENPEAAPEINPPPVLTRYSIICGNENYPTVWICEGGYVGVLQRFFKIGEEYTEGFMTYIEENGTKTEYNPYNGADPNELGVPE